MWPNLGPQTSFSGLILSWGLSVYLKFIFRRDAKIWKINVNGLINFGIGLSLSHATFWKEVWNFFDIYWKWLCFTFLGLYLPTYLPT